MTLRTRLTDRRVIRFAKETLKAFVLEGPSGRLFAGLFLTAMPLAALAWIVDIEWVGITSIAYALGYMQFLRAVTVPAGSSATALLGILDASSGLLLMVVAAGLLFEGRGVVSILFVGLAALLPVVAALRENVLEPLRSVDGFTPTRPLARVRAVEGLEVGGSHPETVEADARRLERAVRRWYVEEAQRQGATSGHNLSTALIAGGLVALAFTLLGAVPIAIGALLITAAYIATWLVRVTLIMRVVRSHAERFREVIDEYGSAYEAAVKDGVHALQPRAVIFLYPFESSYYTLYQWSDLFRESGVKTLVMTVHAHPPLPRPVGLPVVHAADALLALSVLPESVRAVFYITDAFRNVDFARRISGQQHVRHVFLNHGDSDKPINASVSMRLYDELWVAGDHAVERFDRYGVDINPAAFHKIGRPQLEGTVMLHRDGNEPPYTVLYAPTWESFSDSENFSSILPMGLELVRRVLELPSMRVIFRPHPATGGVDRRYSDEVAKISAALNPEEGHSTDATSDLYEQFNAADMLITDVSSVANDFLYTRKPLLMTDTRRLGREEMVTRFPVAEAAYLISDVAEVPALIEEAFGSDPLRAIRSKVRKAALAEPPQGLREHFFAQVRRAVGDTGSRPEV